MSSPSLIPFADSKIEYGPFQFDGYNFWWIYPTRWKIDVYDAIYSMKQDTAKADKAAAIGHAVVEAVNSFLDEKRYKVLASDMWERATQLGGIQINPVQGGQVLSSFDIPKAQISTGKYVYDLTALLEEENK